MLNSMMSNDEQLVDRKHKKGGYTQYFHRKHKQIEDMCMEFQKKI